MEKIEDKIQKTMNSLDGLEKPSLSPLMADRIWKMANEPASSRSLKSLSSKKAMLWITSLAAVVIINISFLNWEKNQSLKSNYENQSSISSIYFDSEISY